MGEQCHICVFAKARHTEAVKTRLASVVGYAGAAALAEAFLQDTWSTVSSLPWAKLVIASTELSIASLVSGNPDVWPQGEGDLGARLEGILSRALKNSPSAIAICGDSPGLPMELLEQAHSALREADAVIGPCEDGGFYLLGLRRCSLGLLAGVPWSQENTCQQTLKKLKAAGLNVRLLKPWFDIDRPRDLTRLQAMIVSGELYAPRTQEALLRLWSGEATNCPRKISVIIPVLNERAYLPQTLAQLQRGNWAHEAIVVDGGSTDGTREWLARQSDVTIVESPPGRGCQLNAGAEVATGDVLLFLHADARLPPDTPEHLMRALESPQVCGGCFCVRFDSCRPRSLGIVAAGINVRTLLTHSATGDQAIFVRRSVFEKIGGFRDCPLFEDVDFVRRMKRIRRFVVIRSPVTASARRHVEYGVFRTVMLIYLLRLAYWAGLLPFTLAKWYPAPNAHSKPREVLAAAIERNVISG